MFNDKSFVNLTSPTYDVKDCLSFGDKFSVEHCKDEVPIFKILKDVEYYIRVNFFDSDRDEVRCKINNAVTNFMYKKVNDILNNPLN